MRLDDQLRTLEASDQHGQRGHVKMATEDDVDGVPEPRVERCSEIAEPARPWPRLVDTARWGHRVGRVARQHEDRRYGLKLDQHTQKIAIILGHATAPAERIGDKGEHRGRMCHAAYAFRRGFSDPANTTRDQRRETSPFGSTTPVWRAGRRNHPSSCRHPEPGLRTHHNVVWQRK